MLDQIDAKGIQYTNVESYDYSKIEDLKRQLKIKAVQAARDKATYLLGSLGQSLGNPLDIQEIDNETFPQPLFRANTMMAKAALNEVAVTPSDIDVKKIKLNYQMRVVFEIK
jgi:uncharacterized protein YggE